MESSSRNSLLPFGMSGIHPVVVAAEAVEVIDGDGRRYIDAASGVGVTCLGYSAGDVVRAMEKQASAVQYVHGLRFETPVVRELAGEIALLAPGDLDSVFFTSGGSEANESAIKLAVQFWSMTGHTDKWKIIGRRPSYHGNTIAALAAGWHAARRRQYGPLLLPFPHVPTPNSYRGCALCSGTCTLACADALETAIVEEGAHTVAAFIAEPVTGAAGGALVPLEGYFQRIRDICNRYDVLLIADEVITGFGRLGRSFGIERFGIVPDILTFGKGVSAGYAPLAGLIAAGRIAGAFDARKARFEHSFTMAGHPVACAAGLATFRRLVEYHLIERVAALEEPFFAVLHEMLDDLPLVGDVRGMGLLAGVELVRDRSTREPFQPSANIAYGAAAAAMDEGVLVYACRGGAGDDLTSGDTLLLMPPFISTENDLREMVIRLARGLERLSSLS